MNAKGFTRLPGHVRASYSFFLTCDETGLEMSVSVNDLPVSLEFGEGSAQAVARAVGLPDDHFEGWRFMSAEETADYIERRNAGEIDDLVEEV